MKTAVVSTYCEWNSFGSVLQAIGLQQILKDIGVDSTVIRLRESKDIKPVKYRKGLNLRSFAVNAEIFLNKNKTVQAHRKNVAFINKHVKVKTYSDYHALKGNPPEADVYIAGSDQIWHPKIKREDFYLNYAPEQKRCVVYAASMGVTELSAEEEGGFCRNLKKFSSLSVREAEMIPVIQRVADKPIYTHIDPVFLRGVDEWRTLQKPYGLKVPYILVYPIYWDKKYNKKLKELKRRTGLPIISIHTGLRNVFADKVIRDADVGEFLWLVDHAQYVITSSFHGVAFSILFNKPFCAVVNPKSPSRINNLLKLLGIKPLNIQLESADDEVDYNEVNKRIREERERSVDYLRREIFSEE